MKQETENEYGRYETKKNSWNNPITKRLENSIRKIKPKFIDINA